MSAIYFSGERSCSKVIDSPLGGSHYTDFTESFRYLRRLLDSLDNIPPAFDRSFGDVLCYDSFGRMFII